MFDRILILQHKGGEYISINISGIAEDRNTIWETLDRAERMLKRPSTTSNVAFQVLDSKLSKEELQKIALWITKAKPEIFRLAVIGAVTNEKRLLNRMIKKTAIPINLKFIYDWDTAKDWLVGNRLR